MKPDKYFGLLDAPQGATRFINHGNTIEGADFDEASKNKFTFIGIIDTSTFELVKVGNSFAHRPDIARQKIIEAYIAMHK